jgi:RNA polymerase sigma factor (sigma-70 family)
VKPTTTEAAIEAVWRLESARLLGGLVRLVHDLELAEDLAQEALLAALRRWPETGIPKNPGAWLMTTAKRRAIDELRRRHLHDRKHHEVLEANPLPATEGVPALDGDVGDDLLRLMLIACHPVLSPDARVALTLRLLGGLTTSEIARAFLVPSPTIAQRIVRAKRTLAEARVPFEVPRGAELAARLESVMEVIYLIFNEGYTASRGDEWTRKELCDEALRLGRVLAALTPRQAEVHGLVALMELQASRLASRRGPGGVPILLPDQDRSRWDRLLIHRGLRALTKAESLTRPLGPFALQAAIAACHARASSANETNWKAIVALYDALAQVAPSPVVELNRAVAVSMAFGAEAALAMVDALEDEPSLRNYHLLPSVRGELLHRLGRDDEARAAFEKAATLTENRRERELLLARARDSTRLTQHTAQNQPKRTL